MKKRVLLVDDEADLRELMKMCIEDEGIEVVEACDGQMAADILKTETFDGIVSDMRMPKLDGLQLLKTVKSISPTYPFMLVTGYSDHSIETIYDLGAEIWLQKPFQNEMLVSEVKRLVGLSQPSMGDIKFDIEADIGDFEDAIKNYILRIGRRGFYLKLISDQPRPGTMGVLKLKGKIHNQPFQWTFSGCCRWVKNSNEGANNIGIGFEVIQGPSLSEYLDSTAALIPSGIRPA